jgi:hypothetical protein
MSQWLGKFKATVQDTNDPEKRGRVKVTLDRNEKIGQLNWAEPCLPSHYISIPKMNSKVWIEFERGDMFYPIWVGVIPTKADFALIKANNSGIIGDFNVTGESKFNGGYS